MYIKYRDDLGYLVEVIDEYGISCDGENMLFNDKCIPFKDVIGIQENENDL